MTRALDDEDGVVGADEGADDETSDVASTVGMQQVFERTAVEAPRAKRKTEAVPAVAVDPPDDKIHEQPTQQIPSGHGLPSTEDTRHSSTTAATPLEALRAEEVIRTRLFLKFCIGIVFAAMMAVLLAGGDPLGQVLVAGGSALVAVTAGWLLHVSRDAAGLTTTRLTVSATLIAAGAHGGVYYWGIVSPINAVILYGVYFFSLGSSRRSTLGLYVFTASLHGTLAALVISGVIEDRGLVRSSQLSLRNQIMTQLVVQFLYLCAYLTARASRRSMVDAVERLDKAVRAVSAREALLAEARAELDRALKVGGPGRYTDQEVGSYKLGMLVGRGGMGEVYEAISVHDRSEAAVKLLHPGALADPQHLRRFLRETEAAAKLESDNVVAVLEVGTTAGEIPFLAMERLRGFDLAHHLRRKRRLSLAQVVTLIRQVGEGLRVARDAGIVHRDIKPHNLFLAEKDGTLTWKILDFGVSKLGRGSTLTRGHVVGTPGYMAPEQARGEEVDWRADLYALTAIAYRCLTGHPPFTGKDVPTTLYDVVYKMPTRPSALVELTDDVDRVLAIGMAKRADDRFADGPELADALAAASISGLAEGLRARADDLLGRHAWGVRK